MEICYFHFHLYTFQFNLSFWFLSYHYLILLSFFSVPRPLINRYAFLLCRIQILILCLFLHFFVLKSPKTLSFMFLCVLLNIIIFSSLILLSFYLFLKIFHSFLYIFHQILFYFDNCLLLQLKFFPNLSIFFCFFFHLSSFEFLFQIFQSFFNPKDIFPTN